MLNKQVHMLAALTVLLAKYRLFLVSARSTLRKFHCVAGLYQHDPHISKSHCSAGRMLNVPGISAIRQSKSHWVI